MHKLENSRNVRLILGTKVAHTVGVRNVVFAVGHSIASAAVTTASQHGWRIWTGVIAALIVLGAAGLGLYSLMHRPAALPFQKFIIAQVTNSGKAAMAAISPDGRYVNIGDETDIWYSHREY